MPDNPIFTTLKAWLCEYFQGINRIPEMKLKPNGTAFPDGSLADTYQDSFWTGSHVWCDCPGNWINAGHDLAFRPGGGRGGGA